MRSISPQSNTSTSHINESSMRGLNNDSIRPSSRAGGTLYEKTKRAVMGEQSRLLNTSGNLAGKRYKGNNHLNIFESSLYLFERPPQLMSTKSTKRVTANMCKSPATASTKALNASNYTSPKNFGRDEIRADDISRALRTSNSKSRLTYHETVSSPQKMDTRNSTTNLLHPYSISRYTHT